MKFLVVFALACALNVGVVFGYEPWAENLDKHESEWRVLKFYPEFFPNAKVTPEGRVVNDYGRDVTYDYVKTAMQSISLLRRNYQTYTPEKAKEDAETLFEVLNGLEEYSFLWEVTTPDPVWYTTPAPGPRYKLATEISIEDLVADALRHDFYVNGVGVPRGFAENAFEAPTTPTAILKTTESAVESSTTKELSNEESNAAFKAEENHKETTDSREIDLEVTTNVIESVSKLEVTEKPTKVFKLHEVLMANITGPNVVKSDLFKVHEAMEPGNVAIEQHAHDAKVHEDMDNTTPSVEMDSNDLEMELATFSGQTDIEPRMDDVESSTQSVHFKNETVVE